MQNAKTLQQFFLTFHFISTDDFEYDDIELKEGVETEIQRLRSLNHMWEQQNHDLESERLRLLRALRTQAQMSTDKGRAQFV